MCDICNNNNKGKTYNNIFYTCGACKKNICPLCRSNHDKKHNIINYEQKDFICDIHNEIYIKYCNNCKKNICLSCYNLHKNHVIISYENIIPDKDEVGNKINRLKNSIDIFKKFNYFINIIIKLINCVF